jgi:uncharacterized protein HemX
MPEVAGAIREARRRHGHVATTSNAAPTRNGSGPMLASAALAGAIGYGAALPYAVAVALG